MQRTVSHNLANAINKLVATDALQAILDRLVIGNLVQRRHICDAVGALPFCDANMLVRFDHSFRVPDITKLFSAPELLLVYSEPTVAAVVSHIEGMIVSSVLLYEEPVPLFDGVTETAADRLLVALSPEQYDLVRGHAAFSEYSTWSDIGLIGPVTGPVGVLRNLLLFKVPELSGHGFGIRFAPRAIELITSRLPSISSTFCEYAETGNFGLRVWCELDPNSLSQEFTVSVLFGVRTEDDKLCTRVL